MTADSQPGHDPIVDRAHVVQILRRIGVGDPEIAAALQDVKFPDSVSHIAGRLSQLGITHDGLIDRMGGSP